MNDYITQRVFRAQENLQDDVRQTTDKIEGIKRNVDTSLRDLSVSIERVEGSARRSLALLEKITHTRKQANQIEASELAPILREAKFLMQLISIASAFAGTEEVAASTIPGTSSEKDTLKAENIEFQGENILFDTYGNISLEARDIRLEAKEFVFEKTPTVERELPLPDLQLLNPSVKPSSSYESDPNAPYVDSSGRRRNLQSVDPAVPFRQDTSRPRNLQNVEPKSPITYNNTGGSSSTTADPTDAIGSMASPGQRTTHARKGEEGEFNYTLTPQGIQEFGVPGQSRLATFTTKSGKKVQVNEKALPRIQGFVKELEDRGYDIRDIGGYSYRQKNGGTGLSTHATGTTIDINSRQNPYVKGRAPITDMPENIEALAGKYGLSWGARFGDSMHFEVMSPELRAKRLQELKEKGMVHKDWDPELLGTDKEAEMRQKMKGTETAPNKFFFDATKPYSKKEIDDLVAKHGNNILLGSNPENEGHRASMDYAKSKGVKTSDYLIGRGEPLAGYDGKGQRFPSDASEINKNIKHPVFGPQGTTREAWDKGDWKKWNFEKMKEASEQGRYAAEVDSFNEQDIDQVQVLKEYQQFAEKNNVSTKWILKNMSPGQWKAIEGEIAKFEKDPTTGINPKILAPFAVSEESQSKKEKETVRELMKKRGISLGDTHNTDKYLSKGIDAVPNQVQPAPAPKSLSPSSSYTPSVVTTAGPSVQQKVQERVNSPEQKKEEERKDEPKPENCW
jgi:hypothetical protein